MTKLKINKVDIYRIVGMGVILVAMGLCQFHKVGNRWVPIKIPDELWTYITGMFTFTAMSIIYQAGVQIQKNSIFIHVVGVAFIGLLGYIIASTYLKIPVGGDWWGAIGIFYAALYGSGNNEIK